MLNEIIKINDGFKNSINLYLDLNKFDKIAKYIPTKASLNVLENYVDSILNNKDQASILIGPYGKGKSHLLLVLLGLLSGKNNKNKKIDKMIENVKSVDVKIAKKLDNVNKKKFLKVIINNTSTNTESAFLLALNEALKREGLQDLLPDTYYDIANDCIKNWKEKYTDTYDRFSMIIKEKGYDIDDFISEIKNYKKECLDIFKDVYEQVTSGGVFNPLVNENTLDIYKGVRDKIVEKKYGYNGIYIVFDEFSKFIESKNKSAVGNDMSILQNMCELANDSKKDSQIFLTFVTHKSIKEYGKFLSDNIINAFTGIEGRIVERYFTTSLKNNYELMKNAIIKDNDKLEKEDEIKELFSKDRIEQYYRKVPVFRTMFGKEEDFEKIIVRGCFPLNPIGAYLLLNISERIAQNERTLFTFISKNEKNSMPRFIKEHTKEQSLEMGIEYIYDYFKNLFKKNVSDVNIHSEFVKAENIIGKLKSDKQIKIVKVIALIRMVSKDEELPSSKNVLELVFTDRNFKKEIKELEDNEYIYSKKKGSYEQYIFKTSVGVNIEKELKNRRILYRSKVNEGNIFHEIDEKEYILPKKYNQEYKMTRYFRYEFMKYEDFSKLNSVDVLFDEQVCDGKVLALIGDNKINSDIDEKIRKKINEFKSSNKTKRLIVLKPAIRFTIFDKLLDYSIIKDLENDSSFIDNNDLLKEELAICKEEVKEEIRIYINKAYDVKQKSKAFYFLDEVKVWEKKSLNTLVSDICYSVFDKTPIINNELINKEYIKTAPIKKARKNIINQILAKEKDMSIFGKRSPEVTIYNALIKRTGLEENNILNNYNDENTNMKYFVEECSRFLDDCVGVKKSFDELFNILEKAPYGMRKGPLSILLAYILCNRNEDKVIYFSDKEVELTADIILNICNKPADYKILISKASKEKEDYIVELEKLFDIDNNYNLSTSRINNIIICMQRWLRALPQYSRNTKQIFKSDEEKNKKYVRVKALLQKAEINPYETLFENIPKKVGLDKYQEVAKFIKDFKKVMSNLMNNHINKVIKRTAKVFDKDSNGDLYHLLKNWYEKQSDISKNGLYSEKITSFMEYIANLDIYDDVQIVKKLVEIISTSYIENWNDDSYEEYIKDLEDTKKEIESIKDTKDTDNLDNKKRKISFTDSNGENIEKYFTKKTTSDASYLKNILVDEIEDFGDISLNDKVAVLVDIIEGIIKK